MALRDVVEVARHDALGDEAYVTPPLGVWRTATDPV
jgi:hypothetical protein